MVFIKESSLSHKKRLPRAKKIGTVIILILCLAVIAEVVYIAYLTHNKEYSPTPISKVTTPQQRGGISADHITFSSLNELKNQTKYIFMGTLGEGETGNDRGLAHTDFPIKITKAYKGVNEGETVHVTELGFNKKGGKFMAEGVPILTPGETYVVFAISGDGKTFGPRAGGTAIAKVNEKAQTFTFDLYQEVGLSQATYKLSELDR